jgi:hypothetical protein
MTKRDLIQFAIVPVMLLVISIALLWLSLQLQHGSERRQADYAVLQRVATSQSSTITQARAQSAQTLSSLALADTESAVHTVSLAQALASLLCVVALFQVASLARLARGRLPASTARVQPLPSSPHEMRLSTHPVPHHTDRSLASEAGAQPGAAKAGLHTQ